MGSATKKRKKTRTSKKKEKLPEKSWLKKGSPIPVQKGASEEKLIKGKGLRPPFEGEVFEKFFEPLIEIKMITAAPIFHVFKQKRVKLFPISL